MRPTAADRIRNVALVGHRGAGKTSLHEALLFEAGVIDRLGSVPDGSTVSDSDARRAGAADVDLDGASARFEWHERKINLLDTPGEPSFVADALGALRVCESAVFVVNAVMGVEVTTARLWQRAAELDIARMLFVNMLDRERADFYRTLEQLKEAFGQHVVATEIPIGSEHEIEGVIDLVDMTAFRQDSRASGGGLERDRDPDEQAERAQEYREKLMDEVCEVSDALMERYLEGEEIAHEEIVDALKEGTNHGQIFPVVCGVATRNLGTTRLLDAIVEDLPSPVKHGALQVGEVGARSPTEDAELFAYVFKTRADPFAGRINLLRVYQGTLRADSHVLNTRAHAKERIGQLIVFAGKETGHLQELGPGDIGAVAKLKETRAGDWLRRARDDADRDARAEAARARDGVRGRAGEPGRRGEGVRRAAPPAGGGPDDRPAPRPADRRADRRGALAGARRGDRRPAARRASASRSRSSRRACPTRRRSARAAKAHGRHKKQSGGRGQFGDCHIEIEPLRARHGASSSSTRSRAA